MTVTAQKAASKAELTLAQRIKKATAGQDFQQAVTLAERGARRYPDFRYPTMVEVDGKPEVRPGTGASFAEVAETLRTKLPTATAEVVERAEPAQTPAVKAPVAKKSVPPKKAVAAVKRVESAPAPEVTVLRLEHTGEVDARTAIFGMEKGSAAQLAIGSAKKGGLGWWFYRDNNSFYIPGSQNYAADMERIGEAVERLHSLKDDAGNQLYRVETAISATRPDGTPLPVRMNARQAQAWQRAYDAARNELTWALTMGQGVCACGVTGLGDKSGRVGKGADGMPVLECATCGAFPEVTVAAPLALPAVPQGDETVECPKCRTMRKVVGGKLELHSFNGGACRGKLGVTVVDVEPEPATAPVRVRKTAPARKAAPAAVEQVTVTVTGDATGLVIEARFVDERVSGQAMRDTAHLIRQGLSSQITYGRGAVKGVRIETRRDKTTKRLIMTVIDGGAGVDAAALAKKVASVVTGVNKFRPAGSHVEIVA